MELVAGRTCPADYRYGAGALARPAELRVETLWVAGGLYGNPFALRALVEAYEAEPGAKALVFNGDFHWFDIAAADFRAVNETVLAFRATRGNVETELARPAAEGCGCGYPEWVDDATVARSNRIVARLRRTAGRLAQARDRLAALPMHLRVDVGEARVAVVHGDAESLAGWTFSQEALASAAGALAARARFGEAQVDVFASSHTCLPVLQRLPGGGIVANNGSAGMPNFFGELCGLATRIAIAPSPHALYSCRSRHGVVEAVPLHYDKAAWERRFLEQWPPGSDAYASYYRRIASGPHYARSQALRLA